MSGAPPWSVGIVIPARDEEAVIDTCLHSVIAAVESAQVGAWIVVVADRCLDRTADRARRTLGDRGEVCVIDEGIVGAARRTGCALALEHFSSRSTRDIWLLSTDADSTVPAEWITVHREAALRGAAAVAGTVSIASFGDRPTGLGALFERRYAVKVAGWHPHLHGTNLGVRADAYTAIGGWRDLATGEDHDLWAGLRAAGYPVVSTTLAPVTTSSRRRSRAPDGFAAYLDALEALPATVSS
ncbi:MAG TPA: glycosyltransferase [Acidimicrobiia bacterium]